MRSKQSELSSLPGEQKWGRRPAKGKSDAMKEIEDWALGGRRAVGATNPRGAGRLADNITEERLLQSRIWDLSRERYKFLSQSDYEKRAFVDRQLKKSAVFKELLKDVDLRKKASPQELLDGQQQQQQHGFRCRSSTLDRHMVNQAFKNVQSRTDSGLRRPAQPRPRPQTVPPSFVAHSKDISKVGINLDKPSVTFPAVNLDLEKNSGDGSPVEGHDERLQRIGSTKSAPAMKNVTFAAMATNRAADHWRKLVTQRRDPQAEEPKPLEDERYQQLESCLCETWGGRGAVGPHVPLVIQSNTSLHVPPRLSRDTKPSLARKLEIIMSQTQMAA